MSQSEIAHIQDSIADEYASIKTALTTSPGPLQHTFIAQRQMKLAEHYNELTRYVSPDEAMKLCLQLAEENLYDMQSKRQKA